MPGPAGSDRVTCSAAVTRRSRAVAVSPAVRVLVTDADHRARLQVHGVLGLVRQARPAVLHLRDLRVRVLGMRPVVVGPLLRALAVDADQFGARRRGDARSPPPVGAGTSRNPRPYPGVRCFRSAALASSVVASMPRPSCPDQLPASASRCSTQVKTASASRRRPTPRARHRRVVRRSPRRATRRGSCRRLSESAARHAIATFRVQALEVAEQQHPEVAARRQARPTDPVGIELGALLLDEGVEASRVENTIQAFVERMARAARQVRTGHPHRRPPPATAALAHCHGRKCSAPDRPSPPLVVAICVTNRGTPLLRIGKDGGGRIGNQDALVSQRTESVRRRQLSGLGNDP